MNIRGVAASSVENSRYLQHSFQTSAKSYSSFKESTSSDRTTISNAAKELAKRDEQGFDSKLDAIRSKGAAERTSEEASYLLKNDAHLAKILSGGPRELTSDELDYVQKAGGFVNTMSKLTSAERGLRDRMISEGNFDAAAGISLIGLARQGMSEVKLPNGKTFDPMLTEITSNNVEELFSQMFVGANEQNRRSFSALTAYLEKASS